jgi:insulysin
MKLSDGISPNDNRQYSSITLANGLTALIISDPTTDRASAALAVGTGALSDPEGISGVAHFLEHVNTVKH